MDDYDGHTGLNVVALSQDSHGLEEAARRRTGHRRRSKARNGPKAVTEGKYDATFIRAVDRLRALSPTAKIVEVPPMAMIEGVTLTTTTTYVSKHEDECRS